MHEEEGTASRVELLKDGTFRIDGGMLVYGHPKYYGKVFDAPLKPLYIEAGEERILVDTGVGDPPEKWRKSYGVDKKTDLLSEMDNIGIKPDDITMVINTHLHFDHTGYNKAFENAVFVSQMDEIRYSAYPDRFQKGAYYQDAIRGLKYRGVAGEREVAPGVTVIPTPGHTPGHQSVTVETEEEVIIYTGDVSPLEVNHRKNLIVGILYDPVEALASLEYLEEIGSWWPEKPKRFIYSHQSDEG